MAVHIRNDRSDGNSRKIRTALSCAQTRFIRKRYIGLAAVLGLFVAPLTAYAVQSQDDTSVHVSETATSKTEQKSEPNPANVEATQNVTTQKSVVSTDDSSPGKNTSKTEVKVNGHNVPVPENGSVHRVIESNDGQSSTQVHIHNSSESNSTNNSSTSTDVHVSSESTSEISVEESL